MPTFARRLPRLALIFGAALAAGSVAAADPAYAPLKTGISLQRVADTGIYYVLGNAAVPEARNEGHTSNAGFVVTGAGVVVFDTLGTPALGNALLEAIRGVTDEPVRYVVVSHYHADHIYGLQAFKDQTDAIIIGQEKSHQYLHGAQGGIRGGIAAERLAQRREDLAPWVNDATRIVEPDLSFSDRVVLRLGETKFTIQYAGPAHAPDDSMMLVEPAGVLFAGDIVQNHRIPVLDAGDVNVGNWLRGLDLVQRLGAHYIIPGHGEPEENATAAITFTGDYLRYLREQMGAAVADWEEFDTAYAQTDWSAWSDQPAFKDINRANAYAVYLDMERRGFEGGD